MLDIDQIHSAKANGWRAVLFCAVLAFSGVGSGCAVFNQGGAANRADVLEQSQQRCECEQNTQQTDEAKVAEGGEAADQAAQADRTRDAQDTQDEPHAITSEEVRFSSKGVELTGVVDRPQEVNEPLAAVVMLHDSGPVDRRGLFAGALGLELPVEVPVYEEIAENLAQNGYVVLRFDKRTCVGGGPPWCSYPREYVEDHREELAGALLADAEAAVDTLRARSDVDPTRVFMLGHGQGAELALALADEVDASGLILLAPSPYPLDEVILHQTETSRAHLEERRQAEGNTTVGTLLQEQLDTIEAAQKEQKEAFARLHADQADDDVLGVPTKTWTGLLDLHDRAMTQLQSSPAPVLAVFGEHDLDLPDDSAEAFQTKMQRSPKSEVMRIEGLTHSMIAIDADDSTAESDGDGTATQVSEDVHQAILHFLGRLDQTSEPGPDA